MSEVALWTVVNVGIAAGYYILAVSLIERTCRAAVPLDVVATLDERVIVPLLLTR